MALGAFTNSARKNFDTPRWLPKAVPLNAPGLGSQFIGDMRNNATRHPYLYHLIGNTVLNAYNPALDDWLFLTNPALGITAAGQCAVFHPSQGPRGTLAAGATTTSVVLSTALPAAVGVNQLANRGDGIGYTMRIVDNASGGTGKIVEATITYNSGGTTPTIGFGATLGFTPTTGSTYELLSGRLFLLGASTPAANSWKYYDVATNFVSASLAFTNLPASVGTDSNLIALSELHVPWNQVPSGGYYGQLTSTAVAAGTMTGQAAAGDAGVFANQWRNFQIRIVQDLTNKTAVGQRRRITSHTAGASPVYTLASNWTVTPASGAFYVIENDDDKIILLSSGQTAVYNYNIAANTWDTTTWAAAVANATGNVAAHAFGIVSDVGLGALNSQIFRIRGGAAASLDVFDIAGAATGAWSNALAYGNAGTTFGTGTSGCYDPWLHQGRFLHLNPNAGQHNVRLDLLNRALEPETYIAQPVSTSQVGCRHAMVPVLDPLSTPPTVMSMVYQLSPGQAFMNALPVFPTT